MIAPIVAIVLAQAPSPTPAELKLIEQDQDGSTIVLGDGIPVVDLNSTLVLQIDRNALRDRLARSFGAAGLPPQFVADVDILQRLLQGMVENIETLAAAHKRWAQSPTQVAFDDYGKARGAAATKVAALIDVAIRSPSLRTKINERLGQLIESEGRPSIESQDRVLFSVMNDELQQLRSELDQHLRDNGVFVQLGGWLVTSGEQRPVHLPGWDQYQEQAPVDIQRFNLVLSSAQKEELAAVAKSATAINSKGLAQAALDHLREAAAAAGTTGTQCSSKIRAALSDAQTKSSAAAANVKQFVTDAAAALGRYDGFLSQLVTKYRSAQAAGLDSAAFLTQTNSDIIELAQRTTELVSFAPKLEGALASMPPDVRPTLDLLAKAIRGCESMLTQVKDGFAGVAADLGLGIAGNINAQLLEFGEKVLRLDAAMIPDRTERSLRGTGPRAAGDTLHFRLAAGRQGAPLTELASKQVSLFIVLPHIETSVVLIFANPNGATAVKAKFQAAPSYSVLYKPGYRSAWYSRFIDFGIGVNVASLDFDMDSVPELGVGLVVSVFRDYLQGGIGYNVFNDHRYWFFGLRLPVGAVSLSSVANDH